ncbi:MAG: hypothetical protein OEV60_10830 [Actinomycetota bacterium]|nr:hypothetical protein [Actinomycetota bacterium]MDH5312996.1 hypothetical protein [Actinomycetota bacterium]
MRSAPALAWVYALLVAVGAAAAANAGHAWVAVGLAAMVVAVLSGSRLGWLVAVVVHVSLALGVLLLAVWPWSEAMMATLVADLVAVALLVMPTMRLDRSTGERAPRGSC